MLNLEFGVMKFHAQLNVLVIVNKGNLCFSFNIMS
jgi:hypothetical protein